MNRKLPLAQLLAGSTSWEGYFATSIGAVYNVPNKADDAHKILVIFGTRTSCGVDMYVNV